MRDRLREIAYSGEECFPDYTQLDTPEHPNTPASERFPKLPTRRTDHDADHDADHRPLLRDLHL